MKKRILLTSLFLVACSHTTGIEAELQGTWISTDDPKYETTFDDGIMTDTYDGAKVSEGEFTIEHSGEGPHLVVEGTERFVYAILELSAEELELMFLSRGNILRFVRI